MCKEDSEACKKLWPGVPQVHESEKVPPDFVPEMREALKLIKKNEIFGFCSLNIFKIRIF